jgi:aryl-alcohol dehydrogenase-like predicted oxidoreductase
MPSPTPSKPDPLHKRPLGKSGMSITRVGFGAWAIGGADWIFGWGAQDDKDSVAAIHHACARGINWIDTAAAYGFGHSEEVVAMALQGMPPSERPYVFTKCGVVGDPKDPSKDLSFIGRADSIRNELEGSLRRLRVDCVDLYQMHWPPSTDATPIEDYWGTMLELKKEGKARAVGLSNHSAAQLEAAEQLGHVDSLQPPFSAISRDIAAEGLPWCHKHETGVIVYSPMQSGLLTGSFSAARAAGLPKNDWRTRSPFFTGPGLLRNLALADALRPIAKSRGVEVGAIAVAWTLAWPGVTAAIVGARSPAQVDGWIAAGRFDLTNPEMQVITAAIKSTGAGTGPAAPTRD